MPYPTGTDVLAAAARRPLRRNVCFPQVPDLLGGTLDWGLSYTLPNSSPGPGVGCLLIP